MKLEITNSKKGIAGFVDIAWGAVFVLFISFALAGAVAVYFHWTGVFGFIGMFILGVLGYFVALVLFCVFGNFMDHRRKKNMEDSK